MAIKTILNDVVTSAKNKVDDVTNTVAGATEELYISAETRVLNTVDSGLATAKKTYTGIVGTIQAFTYAGIAIAFVVAPVPTAVGMAMLWLMELSIDAAKSDIDTQLEESLKKREFDRAVGLLKKYGRIPATAIVETEYVRLEIDSENGTADGIIKKGIFKKQTLSTLDSETINSMINSCPNNESKEIIQAFKAFKAKAKAKNK
ncbi:hypothetical protein [Teredinibacter purpureus]|uniref:hypothetical protein n=1 Tax=Teredinibacter purpureus TaxID=2731756 RepID=UPI0005F79F0C|nr:hypothetical protein [Teredinibacter purpureus]